MAPILALGDIVYSSGSPREFSNCFEPIWGELNSRTLPASGNHEYPTPSAFAYYDYWGTQAGPDRRGYYAVEYNDWLILSLNSEVKAGPGVYTALTPPFRVHQSKRAIAVAGKTNIGFVPHFRGHRTQF